MSHVISVVAVVLACWTALSVVVALVLGPLLRSVLAPAGRALGDHPTAASIAGTAYPTAMAVPAAMPLLVTSE